MPVPMKTLAALAAGILSLSTACAGADDVEPAAADSATTAPAAAEAEAAPPVTARREFDLCVLLPVADVAAILGETAGATVVASRSHVGGGCSYSDREQGVPDVKLLLDFTHFADPAGAAGALAAARSMSVERGMAVQDVPGLGDEAFASIEADRAGVKVRRGGYMGQVNLSVDGTAPATLHPAVQRLARTVLERLP